MNRSSANSGTDPAVHLQTALQQASGNIYIGYSGGLDSSALLHAAVQCGQSLGLDMARLRAVHINHNLHPQSDAWAEHCARQCERLGVALHSLAVHLPDGRASEEAARDARYDAFAGLLQAGDALLVAHHADDQAETLLLRLVRGSGADGLMGMPERRPLGEGMLWRPFLGLHRADLLAWAQAQGIEWTEDPSNADTRYARNYLRGEVLPLLGARWPRWAERAGQAAAHLGARSQVLDHFLQRQYRELGDSSGALALDGLRELPHGLCAELLRYVCRQQRLVPPDSRQMQQLLAQLHGQPAGEAASLPGQASGKGAGKSSGAADSSSGDAGETTGEAARQSRSQVRWGGRRGAVQACQWRGRLWIVAAPAEMPPETAWNPLSEGELRVGDIVLRARAGSGQLNLPSGAALSLRFRRGGERILLAHRGGHREVKKLMQEANIPPWQRTRQPLLYLGDELVALGLNHAWHISSERWCERGGWEISSDSAAR